MHVRAKCARNLDPNANQHHTPHSTPHSTLRHKAKPLRLYQSNGSLSSSIERGSPIERIRAGGHAAIIENQSQSAPLYIDFLQLLRVCCLLSNRTLNTQLRTHHTVRRTQHEHEPPTRSSCRVRLRHFASHAHVWLRHNCASFSRMHAP